MYKNYPSIRYFTGHWDHSILERLIETIFLSTYKEHSISDILNSHMT